MHILWRPPSCAVWEGPVPADPLWSSTQARQLADQRQVGALIRLGRQHRSWTLAHLGDQIGCSPATVSRLERRTRVADLALLQQAALAVGMPRVVLVTSLAPPSATAPAATRVFPPGSNAWLFA
ncbi:helix-turn-helix domain-containing protein [Streptomyces sp. NPDC056468]|uniref:helix-turn-helix domain-containing protein n=1 Tax=Streptomyces sp. NPDC056468 TaxID=3345830 RepID=UPI0036C59590